MRMNKIEVITRIKNPRGEAFPFKEGRIHYNIKPTVSQKLIAVLLWIVKTTVGLKFSSWSDSQIRKIQL